MADTQTLNSSDSESCCVVCFKNVDIHSIGSCDHPVCFECSTRLRVLCESMECPICRQDMPKVIFSKEVKPYSELITTCTDKNLVDDSRGIYFCSAPLKRRYDRLLEHECQICKKSARLCLFSTFNQLKDHVRKTHDLYFCPLCVSNLKIFTFERRCYTRSELATHNRKGDPDDTSHRGHPLCEFCTNHFMDNDELYRHLRRDHCYCHFCDADGKHQYYNTLRDLRKHYLDEHYVCEEGECITERYTSVFRSDIDLKAHYNSVHGRYLGKAAARQARTLDIEFTLKPRRTGNNAGEFSRPPGFQEHEVHFTTTNAEYRDTEETSERERGVTCNILSTENFPALGSAPGSAPPISISTFNSKTNPNPFRRENFPSLGGSNPNSSRAPSVTITGKFNIQNSKNGAHKKQPTTTNSTTFAFASGSGNKLRESSSQDLPKAAENKPIVNRSNNGNYGQVVSVRPKLEDFPQLGGSSVPTQQSTPWVSQKQPKKVEPKVNKVAPAPKLPSNNNENFPTLGGKSGKGGEKNRVSTSVTIPVSDSWVNLNSFNNHTKVNGGTGVAKPKPEKPKDNKHKNNENMVKSSKTVEMTSTNNESSKFVSGDNSGKNKKKKGKNANEKPIDKQASNAEHLNSHNPPNTPNGKKRSELNVEVREPDTNNVSKPPPGFNVKPPPGFNNFVLSNNLTFTNSSGQSYSIVSSEQFYPPLNFKSRNQSLIEKFMTVLNDPNAMQQFKVYSDMFRAGEIPAEKYYDHCERIMDKQFDLIFPELLVLLPNIEKQQNLYRIHQSKRGNTKGLEVCATCKQVVLPIDLRNHLSNHTLETHFPVLSSSTTVNNNNNNNVWHRK